MTRLLVIVQTSLFLMLACGARDEGETAPETSAIGGSSATGGSSSTGGNAATGGSTSKACECPLFEDKPSASAKYIAQCGDFAMYEEPSIGIPSSLFVCVRGQDAATTDAP